MMPSMTTSQIGGRIIPAKSPIQKAAESPPQSLYFSLKKTPPFPIYYTICKFLQGVTLEKQNKIMYNKHHIKIKQYSI